MISDNLFSNEEALAERHKLLKVTYLGEGTIVWVEGKKELPPGQFCLVVRVRTKDDDRYTKHIDRDSYDLMKEYGWTRRAPLWVSEGHQQGTALEWPDGLY